MPTYFRACWSDQSHTKFTYGSTELTEMAARRSVPYGWNAVCLVSVEAANPTAASMKIEFYHRDDRGPRLWRVTYTPAHKLGELQYNIRTFIVIAITGDEAIELVWTEHKLNEFSGDFTAERRTSKTVPFEVFTRNAGL